MVVVLVASIARPHPGQPAGRSGRAFTPKGADLFLYRQGPDTSTPSGRAMFQMLGVFAEFEDSMNRERALSGLGRHRRAAGG
jgi:DNA invertase Pin-like site-specific DNA recombinase